MSRYVQRSGYVVTELDNDYLILNTDHFTVTKLNEVGGFCWNLLREAQTVESLVKAIQNQFSPKEDEATLNRDMESFLLDLKDCRLIQHVG